MFGISNCFAFLEDLVDLGERLKAIRKRQGLSQRELAKRAGVTNSTISMIEKNTVSPSFSSLLKVLKGFPMSVEEFFTLDLVQSDQVVFRADEQAEMGNLPGFSGFHNDRCLEPNALTNQMMMDCSSGQK